MRTVYIWWWLSDFRAFEPYTLSGIPVGEPPSCEAPRQPTMYDYAEVELCVCDTLPIQFIQNMKYLVSSMLKQGLTEVNLKKYKLLGTYSLKVHVCHQFLSISY